jgi:hypothetical protein
MGAGSGNGVSAAAPGTRCVAPRLPCGSFFARTRPPAGPGGLNVRFASFTPSPPSAQVLGYTSRSMILLTPIVRLPDCAFDQTSFGGKWRSCCGLQYRWLRNCVKLGCGMDVPAINARSLLGTRRPRGGRQSSAGPGLIVIKSVYQMAGGLFRGAAPLQRTSSLLYGRAH